MAKKRSAEELSDEELRWLLIQKRRAARQERLDRFRRTGRVLVVAPDPDGASLESLRSDMVEEDLAASPAKSRRKRILDGFLLLVEIGAVVGILFVVFNGLNVIRELNREVASSLQQPTLTPTPLIVAVVLPSGHTPPNSPGGAKPNDAEIPEHLRPLTQSLVDLPVPTQGPEQAIRIQVPAINVDAQIVQGDGWEQLKKGVGQRQGSADLGKKGNIVLSAHNDVFGEIFRDLDQLKPGNKVVLFSNQRSYTYEVVETRIVEPTDMSVVGPASDPVVTLISCYPYLVDKQRIVVIARLQAGG